MITQLLKIIAEADAMIEDCHNAKTSIKGIHDDLKDLEKHLSMRNQSEL